MGRAWSAAGDHRPVVTATPTGAVHSVSSWHQAELPPPVATRAAKEWGGLGRGCRWVQLRWSVVSLFLCQVVWHTHSEKTLHLGACLGQQARAAALTSCSSGPGQEKRGHGRRRDGVRPAPASGTPAPFPLRRPPTAASPVAPARPCACVPVSLPPLRSPASLAACPRARTTASQVTRPPGHPPTMPARAATPPSTHPPAGKAHGPRPAKTRRGLHGQRGREGGEGGEVDSDCAPRRLGSPAKGSEERTRLWRRATARGVPQPERQLRCGSGGGVSGSDWVRGIARPNHAAARWWRPPTVSKAANAVAAAVSAFHSPTPPLQQKG